MVKRCAIYTRKSSEEGLEQDYTSLHAQHEACEAFIRSQAGEGWRLIRTAYDDGGFSGGAMERPALQRLLADIRQGLVEVVVVYKVDRLTRALADFAKMVELFDARGVSFVAVTQQFNTTTSMGRLTLNMLLSFAQFEREVIGERIRDKIAGSKRKGIWMGDALPLGYQVHSRKLVVNPEEAQKVRQIFERYLELGSVRLLKIELEQNGIVSGIRVSSKGKSRGGQQFSRGALYHLLANPIYIGEIRHRRERHPGQHEAILSRDLRERVQQRLRVHKVRSGDGSKTAALISPLAGRLFDESGVLLYVQGAAKGPRRYRYYVSKRLVRGESKNSESAWRLSALEIERTVAAAAAGMLADESAITLALDGSGVDPDQLPSLLQSARSWIVRLQSRGEAASALGVLVERVDLRRDSIRVSLTLPIAQGEEHDVAASDHIGLARTVTVRMKRRGIEKRVVLDGKTRLARIDLPLLKAVARGCRWSRELRSGQAASVRDIPVEPAWPRAMYARSCRSASCHRESWRRSSRGTSHPN